MCLTALGFLSSAVLRFAGSWGGGVRVTRMARRAGGSAHITITHTTARETLAACSAQYSLAIINKYYHNMYKLVLEQSIGMDGSQERPARGDFGPPADFILI